MNDLRASAFGPPSALTACLNEPHSKGGVLGNQDVFDHIYEEILNFSRSRPRRSRCLQSGFVAAGVRELNYSSVRLSQFQFSHALLNGGHS